MANAEIWIKTSENLAQILKGSLLPEVERPSSERSTIWVRVEDDGLVIRIEASDTAALRATSNSYLRWVAAIFDVVETVR